MSVLSRSTGLQAILPKDQEQDKSSLYFDKKVSFANMGLDRRLFKAVARTGYIYPSLVQTQTIPLILEGKDVLVKARTGTGKTAAYVLPLLHQILAASSPADAATAASVAASVSTSSSSASLLSSSTAAAGSARPSAQAIILVPTRDLCEQVLETVKEFSSYCRELISAVALSGESSNTKSEEIEASKLRLNPNIIISTPARLLLHLQSGAACASNPRLLVVDEADLVLSYGYEDDVKALTSYFPKFLQTVLMSATLSPELDRLRGVLLHSPVTVQLDENDRSSGAALQQYYLECGVNEKFLLVYVHIAFGLFKGKTIFFVNSVSEAFRLKLFLEQFSIPSAVLNDDLPLNSRRSIITQFNRGAFDYVIATDVSNSELDSGVEAVVEDAVKLQVFSSNDAAEMKSEEEEEQNVKSNGNSKRKREEADDDDENEDDDEDEDEDADDDDEEDEEEDDEEEDGEEDENEDEDADEDEEEDADDVELKTPSALPVDSQEGQKLLAQLEADEKTRRADLYKGKKTSSKDAASSATAAQTAAAKAKAKTLGVSRGVDFADVQAVVNVDFPLTVKAYVHRIGRTARAGKSGQAFSYVSPDEMGT